MAYRLNPAEKAVLLRKMDAYCQEQTGQALKHQKYRFWCNFTVLGESIALIFVCIFLKPSIPVVLLVVLCLGYGCFASVESTAFLMAAQCSLSPSQMGAGTSTTVFAQALAGLLGTTIGGTILNGSVDGAVGIHNVYVFAAVITIIGSIIVVAWMPGKAYMDQVRAKAMEAEGLKQQ